MTGSKRIALNIAATYGWSLFALVCGLFTSRWVLKALGQSDYGLCGVSGDGPKAARCPLYTATIQQGTRLTVVIPGFRTPEAS